MNQAISSEESSVVPLTPTHALVQEPTHATKRITPKQEIDKLRAVAATLEEKVCELKRQRENDNSSEDTPFWKRVAIRIANEQSEAERENIRLRTLVNTHQSTIQTITRSVTSVAQLSVRCALFAGRWPLNSWACARQNDSSIRPIQLQESYRPHGVDKSYEQIFASVAAAYAELGNMVRNSQCEMPVSWKGTRQVQVDIQQQTEGVQLIQIRLEEARLAPFAWTMTTAYAWDFLCRFNEEKNTNGLPRVGLKTYGYLELLALM